MGAANNHNQSAGALLQKRCFYKFCKIHTKTPKKRFRHRCFLVNSAKFPIAYFLKNASNGCFSINTGYVHCPNLIFCLFKNDVTHFLAEYFLDLICSLGTRVSSVFEAFSQKSIFNPAEHLQLSFLAKIVYSLKPSSIFA